MMGRDLTPQKHVFLLRHQIYHLIFRGVEVVRIFFSGFDFLEWEEF